MKRTWTLILLLELSALTNLSAQELSHQVLVPISGILSSSTFEYTHTTGEAVVELAISPDLVLTQGFQQPRIDFNDTASYHRGNGVRVYPNPVEDMLYIELFGVGERTFRIEIINLQGIIRISEKVTYSGTFLQIRDYPVGELSRGLYLVRVVSEDGLISRIFKIQKF